MYKRLTSHQVGEMNIIVTDSHANRNTLSKKIKKKEISDYSVLLNRKEKYFKSLGGK